MMRDRKNQLRRDEDSEGKVRTLADDFDMLFPTVSTQQEASRARSTVVNEFNLFLPFLHFPC